MALCVALFGKDNSLFSFKCDSKEVYRENELQMFVHCSLDIIDEKWRISNKTQELYLGNLLRTNVFQSYGYVTNTNIRFILVVDANNAMLKDQDIRAMFKRLHTNYCKAIFNPFYVPSNIMHSKYLNEVVSEIFSS
uniref:Trafficking protein particle complex subunit 2-like protein n=1 Tax=Acrobeloides nanus TaxID=290746 RepID=A0A914BWZ5_9BILA